MTLVVAATAAPPAAVLTGPVAITGLPPGVTRLPRPPGAGKMARVSIEGQPLTATAALIWNGDLPRPLQQILFDTADALTPPARQHHPAPADQRCTPPDLKDSAAAASVRELPMTFDATASYCRYVVFAVALAGIILLIGRAAWTARLVHVGNLDAQDLADKVAVSAPVSALDWPELHLNAVVAQPTEQAMVLLHVDWPAHPQRAATLLWLSTGRPAVAALAVTVVCGPGVGLTCAAGWCGAECFARARVLSAFMRSSSPRTRRSPRKAGSRLKNQSPHHLHKFCSQLT